MKLPLCLIVTFNPPPEFFTDLDSFYTQLDQVLLVDNGSNPEVRHRLEQEVLHRESSLKVISNQANLGIATALNQGFRWALEHNYRHILVFDQDSRPLPGMLSAMLAVISSHAKGDHLAIVAPAIIDPAVNLQARYLRPKNKWLYERVSCNGDLMENITYVITSGSLYDLKAYQQIGPFRDDFFIDYVDTEYCLRARQFGYEIVVACKARISHRQGERQERAILGAAHYPTFHPPSRWYYISRNRISMLRQYAFRFPHWFFYEIVASIYMFMKMLLFETQKTAKMWAFFHGTLDGIRGRQGKMPE